MDVSREEFAKLLQDNESRLYWQSGKDAPEGVICHEWHLVEGGAMVLMEIQSATGSTYFARKRLLD